MSGSLLRTVRWIFLVLAVATGAGACDPCFGTSVCGGERDISYFGQILNRKTGEPVANAEVTFVRRGGAALESDSFVVSTDERGEFRLRSRVVDPGEVVADLTIRPPAPLGTFGMTEVRLIPTVEGDERFLQRLYADPPYLPYLFEIFLRGTSGPARGVQLQFRRTGGIGVEEARFNARANAEGKAWITPTAQEPGVLEGTLIVRGAGPEVRIPGFRLATTYRHDEVRHIRQGVGSSISYHGTLVYGGTGRPAAGVEVEISRVGGLAVRPNVFRSRTDAAGNFSFPTALVDPYATGVVDVDLTVRPPAPYLPLEVRGVRLATFQADGLRPIGRWTLEAPWYLPYYVEMFVRGTGAPVADAEIEFRRTDGIRVQEDVVRVRSDAEGRFWITPTPLAGGELIGDLVVRLPTGESFTRTGVRLSTTQRADDVRRLRLGIGPSLSYLAHLDYADTGRPAAGVEVEIRRTGGLAVEPDTVVVRTDAAGNFNFPISLEDPFTHGDVVVDLVVRPPAPYRTFTVPALPVPTFDTDEYRYLGEWRVPAP